MSSTTMQGSKSFSINHCEGWHGYTAPTHAHEIPQWSAPGPVASWASRPCSSSSVEYVKPSRTSPSTDVKRVVRPRRRSTGHQPGGKPITLTIEVLEKLYCMKLSLAAKTIGISVSALKIACRSLGVRSWPHRFQDLIARPAREPSAERDTPPDTPPQAVEHRRQHEETQVAVAMVESPSVEEDQ
eukprot:1749337-Rhodomonas_salina.2